MDHRFISMEIRSVYSGEYRKLFTVFTVFFLRYISSIKNNSNWSFEFGLYKRLPNFLMFSINISQTDTQFPYNFDDLRQGDRVGLICDDKNRLHIIVNDTDQGFVEHEVSSTKYAMLDLYGRCEQLAVVPCNKIPELRKMEPIVQDIKSHNDDEKVSVDESKGGVELFFTE